MINPGLDSLISSITFSSTGVASSLDNPLKNVNVKIKITKIEIKSEIGAAYKIPLIPSILFHSLFHYVITKCWI